MHTQSGRNAGIATHFKVGEVGEFAKLWCQCIVMREAQFELSETAAK